MDVGDGRAVSFFGVCVCGGSVGGMRGRATTVEPRVGGLAEVRYGFGPDGMGAEGCVEHYPSG